jgi:hypothetical protein
MDKQQPAGTPVPHTTVSRCLICGHAEIDRVVNGRFVKTECRVCRATLVIEFDPPDQPGLRARIERINQRG